MAQATSSPAQSISVALLGSGGAGVITTGALLLQAAARAGWYGLLTRSVGPQIRGGEAAALIRLSPRPVACHDDRFHLVLALDWLNANRFAAEIPLGADSLIVADQDAGEIPPSLLVAKPAVASVAMQKAAKAIRGGRANMVALGIIAEQLGLPEAPVASAIERAIGSKGAEAVAASLEAVAAGRAQASSLSARYRVAAPTRGADGGRWIVTGNEAAGFGALRGGIRFVAAYPITPATEILEWLSPALPKLGGMLVQAEDELASINMVIGAAYGGTPSLTATSGPGLALMTESLGLAVAAEIPLVVVDVMRGGPSTGIPTKSEQSDLNIAIYGMHGDAPHLVLAPTGVADCLFTTQWAVHLAESLQTPAIVLSDQLMGQSHAVIDRPVESDLVGRRARARTADGQAYHRYAPTPSGVSPMAVPGVAGCQYTADGLEHTGRGTPSSQAEDHRAQMDKRREKLAVHDYGSAWADIEGEPDADIAVITWGSTTASAREAIALARAAGVKARLIAIRLLSPAQPERLAAALAGMERALVVEQSHSGQFYRYLRAFSALPAATTLLHRPGPLPFRPGEILSALHQGV
jgi:2-oxoglutarate ferredoxin oxidoreductase subunit alpha